MKRKNNQMIIKIKIINVLKIIIHIFYFNISLDGFNIFCELF